MTEIIKRLICHLIDFLCRFYPQNKIIIEVGAHSGDRRLMKSCSKRGYTLYLFEPNPGLASQLKSKAKRLKNVHVVQKAVAKESGQTSFFLANHDTCSSLLPFHKRANDTWVAGDHPYKNFETKHVLKVETITLKDFFRQEKIDHVDFIEIDAQGSDLDVVQSLGAEILNVNRIQVESLNIDDQLYESQPDRLQVEKYFSSMDFILVANYPQSLGRELNQIFRNKRHPQNVLDSFFNPYLHLMKFYKRK